MTAAAPTTSTDQEPEQNCDLGDLFPVAVGGGRLGPRDGSAATRLLGGNV